MGRLVVKRDVVRAHDVVTGECSTGSGYWSGCCGRGCGRGCGCRGRGCRHRCDSCRGPCRHKGGGCHWVGGGSSPRRRREEAVHLDVISGRPQQTVARRRVQSPDGAQGRHPARSAALHRRDGGGQHVQRLGSSPWHSSPVQHVGSQTQHPD